MRPLLLAAGGLTALAAFLLSALLTPVAGRLARRWGLLDEPGAHKAHGRSVPYGGGPAIVVSLLGVIGLGYLAGTGVLPLPRGWRTELSVILQGMLLPATLLRLGGLLGGGLVMFGLGLADDRRPLRPGVKLLVQVAAAGLLFAGGVRVTLFIGNPAVQLILTVLWVVGITNAINFMDNMDGLAAGVGAVAACIFFAVAAAAGQVLVAGLAAGLAGALLGFLGYNVHPARLFMGDAGSLFTGYLLAGIAIAGRYYDGGGAALAAVMPVVVLALPIFDTASVMLIRWRTGAPLWRGDRNHFSHRLVRLGMTQREAVLTIYLLMAALGAVALLLRRLDTFGAVLVLLHTAGILGVIGLLEHAAHRRAR